MEHLENPELLPAQRQRPDLPGTGDAEPPNSSFLFRPKANSFSTLLLPPPRPCSISLFNKITRRDSIENHDLQNEQSSTNINTSDLNGKIRKQLICCLPTWNMISNMYCDNLQARKLYSTVCKIRCLFEKMGKVSWKPERVNLNFILLFFYFQKREKW